MSTGNGTIPALAAVATFAATGGNIYAAQGAYMVASYLDPIQGPTQSGPRISDLSVQTSTYGAVIPRTYGTVAVMGNVFWLEHNELKEVAKKKKSGGKGGGSSVTTKTYSYFATMAVGLCIGPVDGIRRIWAGPDLVYDAGSGDINSIIASNATKAKNFTFYLGGADQLPDSRMQADLGVGNTSAYRGLCYVVVKDFALAKYGNAIPPFKFEIVKRAVTPSTLFQEDHWTQASAYNANGCTGHPMDARGAMNYVYQEARYAPIIHASIFEDGRIYRTLLPAEWSSAGEYFTATPIASSLIKSSFAFVNITAGGGYQQIYWGGGIAPYRAYGYSGAPAIRAFAEDEDGNGFVLRGTGSPYTVDAVSQGVLMASVVLPAGFAPMMTIYGRDLVLIHNTGTQLDVRVYDSAGLALQETYTIAGVSTSGVYGAPQAGSPVVVGKCVLTANDLRELVYVDLAARTAAVFNVTAPVTGAGSTQGMSIDLGGVIAHASLKDTSGTHYVRALWKLEDQTEVATTLQEIISAESAFTGLLSTSDIDVTELTDTATGYRVSKVGSIRNAIDPLQAVWPFDVVQSGYKIKFRKRGKAPVVAASISDLGVDEQLRQVREMDSQMPTELSIDYLDRGRNYDPNQQRWAYPSTVAVNTRAMEIPVVLAATQAAQVVERLGYLYWLERTDFGPFTLPPTFGALEPADVITLDAGYAGYELRLTSINYKSTGELECTAKLNSASTYVSLAESDDVGDGTVVGRSGPSTYRIVDIPVVDETLQNAPGFVVTMAGYTDAWDGGTIWRTADAGQTWDDLQSFSYPGTFGTARTPLAAHAGNLIDRGSSITVDLICGSLFGVTEDQMLNGANLAAYGVPGRWEILRFINATQNADSSYTLTGLWRGDKGTEWATGLHAAGDSFVLLDDPDGSFVSLPTELIGVPRDYRGVSSGADIDTDVSQTYAYAGVNLKPLSPSHAKGVRTSGDIAITWKRRTRIGGSWRDNVDASLGETTEAYEVDVMSGAAVKRTLTSATPAATYTAADQVTDFGATQASITVRIYQLSSVVGRGYPLEVTL